MVPPGTKEVYETGDSIDTTGCLLSSDWEVRSVMECVNGRERVLVAFIPATFLTRDEDLLAQLLVDDPMFPALSFAVARIMNVPAASEGILSE